MTSAALLLLFATVSKTFNIPEGLLASLCKVESGYDVKAINIDDGNSSSIGVCQIKHQTASYLGFKGSETRLQNPKVNAFYAAKYLHRQLDRYNGNVSKAVSAYNAGSCRLNNKGQIKNRKYVSKVMLAWKEWGHNEVAERKRLP